MKNTIKVILLSAVLAIGFNKTTAQEVSFYADIYEGCAPLTVNFTNTSTVGAGYI
ncbi:MAG: hypothetical protein HY738_20525, partial [Bacteroidia bacterium]|nr:hypothetical protein [Bacteroidia bacterium]